MPDLTVVRAILLHAAMVGYDQQPDYQPFADGQKGIPERVFLELKFGNGPLARALETEGMLAEWLEDEEGSKRWADRPDGPLRGEAKL